MLCIAAYCWMVAKVFKSFEDICYLFMLNQNKPIIHSLVESYIDTNVFNWSLCSGLILHSILTTVMSSLLVMITDVGSMDLLPFLF